MKTYKQYLNKDCTHSEYYSQFVTEEHVNKVVSRMGKDYILNSKDPDFNDSPLKHWDSIGITSPVSAMMEKAGEYLTLAGAVCIHKQAARQFKELNQ